MTATEAPPGLRRALRELPREAVVLLVGVAVNRLGSMLQIFLVLYLTDIGYRPAEAGLVLGSYGIGSIAGDFAGGALSDRLGPRRTVIWSMACSAVLIGTLGHVEGYATLMALSLVIGVVTHLYWPASLSMLAAITPGDRLVVTSAAFRLALNVGATLAPLVGVFLAARSYTMVFTADAVTSLVFAAVAAVLLPDARPAPSEAAGEAGEAGEADQVDEATRAAARAGYREVLRDRRFVAVVAATLAVGLAEVQYLSVLPLEIEASDLPTTLYATILAINGAMVIFFELPLTPFVQRLSMRTTIAVGSFLVGAGIALFGLPGGAAVFLLGAVVWTVGEMVSMPSVHAYPALVAPEHLRGRYIGAVSTSQTVGYALGPMIGTALYEELGAGMWSMCLVLAVAAGIGMWYGVVQPPRPSTTAVAAPAVEGATA